MNDLTPREIVDELDKYIVGQTAAKRAIAVAVRNRWRRQQLDESMRDEVAPKNLLMIGPTGVGKTEVARRLASLTGAPFIKVDATKYTEVGYYGSDVESMGRELIENAIGIVRAEEREKNEKKAKDAAEERLVEAFVDKFIDEGRDLDEFADPEDDVKEPSELESNSETTGDLEAEETSDGDDKPSVSPPGLAGLGESMEEFHRSFSSWLASNPDLPFRRANEDDEKPDPVKSAQKKRLAKRVRRALAAGALDGEILEVENERTPGFAMRFVGGRDGLPDLEDALKSVVKRRGGKRMLTVDEARAAFLEKEFDAILDDDQINARAIKLAEELGIIFIDEIDKIVGAEGGHGADVSRQGVQRDLLPIVEGTVIKTRYGSFSTKSVLFIAAGAFHRVKPSDLTPELQGRFPIRVELTELTKEDFVRILTEPKNALTKQYVALMKTENIELVFEDSAVDAIADYAARTNLSSQNIGARRLYAMMERLLEDLSFEAPEMTDGAVRIDAAYVKDKIEQIALNEDLSRYIL